MLNRIKYDKAYVSVIIPVYENQSGIDTCLEAIAEQDYSNKYFEVIVVDNDSIPPIQINPRIPNTIKTINCKIPGAYAARNAGIKFSHGDILVFTDSDCVPNANWLTEGVNALNRFKGRCIIGGEVVFHLSDQPTAVELYQYLNGFMQRENIEQRKFSATANLFVTRSQMETVGNFDEQMMSGGDREWCWRAEVAGFRIVHDPNTIVFSNPRTSISGAIRQTKRVAAGRYYLNRIEATHVTYSGIRPHRSTFLAAKWILTHPDLSTYDKIRVFSVASILKSFQIIENVSLRFGATAERR